MTETFRQTIEQNSQKLLVEGKQAQKEFVDCDIRAAHLKFKALLQDRCLPNKQTLRVHMGRCGQTHMVYNRQCGTLLPPVGM